MGRTLLSDAFDLDLDLALDLDFDLDFCEHQAECVQYRGRASR